MAKKRRKFNKAKYVAKKLRHMAKRSYSQPIGYRM